MTDSDASTSALPPEVLAAAKRGWSVIPIGLNNKPLIVWKDLQNRRATLEELVAWGRKRPAGWGVVTGKISNLVIVDFDKGRGVASMEGFALAPHARTGSGGGHVYFKYPGWHVPTLNSKAKKSLGAKYPNVDVRGDGGYAIFHGRNAQGIYQLTRDPADLESLDRLPMDLRELLGLAPASTEQLLLIEKLRKALGKSPEDLAGI